ncbi:hypothetical protein AU252_09470 [Pseudarthrobacter sulfonivorans]|uniref:Uncharacterized protein n=1 Tax=Pseudarthrobacter sulfonivorans TaxID=121292 RepID=A0A0U3FR61_9MICC|nr:hypothetical protein AU252_09470 [Pseudarthrobacter sulfonivorans]
MVLRWPETWGGILIEAPLSGNGATPALAGQVHGNHVVSYNRQLMMAILHEKVQIAKAVNATAIPLEDAPRG